MGTITHEGVQYPVTDAWDAANNQPWPDLAAMEETKRVIPFPRR